MHKGRLASPKLRCFDLAQTGQGLWDGPIPEQGGHKIFCDPLS